ncbi:ImmA/IrrE family metallo-endopeptidase [Puniceicoccus vermicola]|uniref:ImmA/IrrE family metallo-endopeptidase n=1 Tax=Puniceicoccus vermicola TaxID=388746 RepID=A0A7X1AWA0_9BACT|nr:ImmA/IrrE family metallo-endopeptidase [Puniceicoccus vermicola]MBC2601163.1 ImmA/IrrE family metallo-endopeptidase [Puniceicoccus vermicola]
MRDPNYIGAEACSFGLLQRFTIDDPTFPIENLAYALGVDIEYGGITNADAWLLKCDNGRGVIRLNKTITSPSRQRFSIAHELGHWVMHTNVTQGYLCTAKDLQDYGRSPEEAEANWFAATLLMPKSLIPSNFHKRDPSFEYIMELASHFQTSFTSTARRFVELSRQPVVLISSSSGVINWSARSQNAKYYFLPNGSSVPRHSLTEEVTTKGRTKGAPESVEPEIWFPERTFSEDEELFEEVKCLVNYDISLTLLWFPQ